MNKRVIITMLGLVIGFLVFYYVLEFIFPNYFTICVNDERILNLGRYIDTHIWAYFIFSIVIGILLDYLYFGACVQQYKFKATLYTVIISYNVLLSFYYSFVPVEFIMQNAILVMGLSNAYMVLTPMFYTNNIKTLSITYSVNVISQTLMLTIRNIVLTSADSNSLTSLLIGADNYLWLGLCFILFNFYIKKGDSYGTH